jgi:hypothetical protein
MRRSYSVDEALMDAIRNEDLDKIREIAPTTDINKRFWYEFHRPTPIAFATEEGVKPEVLELLLSLGAVVTGKDSSSIQYYSKDTYRELFLKHGYNISELAAEYDRKKALEDEFAVACTTQDLKNIRRLAPHFDMSKCRFNLYAGSPSPLVVALDIHGKTEALELLLELGAVPNPYDAYHIRMVNHVDVQMPEEHYENFFLKRGYNLKEIASQLDETWRLPSDQEEDEYSDSDSDSEKSPKDNRSLLQRYFDKRK